MIFFALGGAGMLLAFIFDCYRVGRYFWRPGLAGTFIGDGLFGLFLTALTLTLLMLINQGEARAYVFLALSLGLALYFVFLSRGVRRWLYAAGRILGGVAARACRLAGQTVVVVVFPGRLLLNVLLLPLAPVKAWLRHRRPAGPGNGTG